MVQKTKAKAKTKRPAIKTAYEEGKTSFEDGAGVDACRYRKNSVAARHWRFGWYDARTRKRLGHIFDRWGIEYP